LLNSTHSKFADLLFLLALSVIAGGRWITQIWLGPVPFADVIFQGILFLYLLRKLLKPNRDNILGTSSPFLRLTTGVILFWSLLRITTSILSHEYSAEVIFRDSMFIIAISLVFISKGVFHNFGFDKRVKGSASQKLTFASLFAFLTGILSQFLTDSVGWNFDLPIVSLQSNIFSVRSDQLICATSFLIISLCAKIVNVNFKIIPLSLLLLIMTCFLFLFSSRAVLLASGLIFAIGLLLILKFQGNESRNWPIVLFCMSPLFLIYLQRLPGVNRLLAGFGLGTTELQNRTQNLNAISTQNARQEAWKMVTDYWTQNSFWFGFKPGEHVVQNSGALRYLSGEIEVRWPHNIFLSIMFRNGLMIGIFFCSLLLYILFMGLKNILETTSELLDFQLFAFLVSCIVVSSVGVVLESPFGYIPFTIISGMVLARREIHQSHRVSL
jgi:hypothetical protein